MSKVAIITDTSNCLPPELIKEYAIRAVPLHLSIDGKSYRDQVEISSDEFWAKYKSAKLCSTGAPAPGDYVSAFDEASKETDKIVCITLGRALSATYESALQARDIFKSEHPAVNIELIDSKTAIGALGFVVFETARAARAGKSMTEVIEVAQDIIGRVKWVVGLLSTQTQKFGRTPQTVFEGLTPQLVPFIAMLHGTGKVEDAGKAHWKKECLQRMIEIAGENSDLSKPLHIMVHYTTSKADGEQLLQMARAKFKPVESYLTPYSPTLGASSGPAIALIFYS